MNTKIWVIEKLWTDNLENDVDSARGYEMVGFVETEEQAKSIIDNGGMYTGICWAVSPNTPNFRSRLIYKLV